MALAYNYAGMVFGRLTAVGRAYRHGRVWFWTFRCECGATKDIRLHTVTSGRVRSCGCLHRERARSGLNQLRHGHARVGHVTRLHNLWRGMLKRVDATIGGGYEKYAARGIKVCPEWRRFETFRDWAITNGYADTLSIDRINNNGDYEPSNCRWTTATEQCRNRRSSRSITAFGQSRTLAEWSEVSGIKAATISARISLLWSPEDAVTKALHSRR